MRSVSKNLKYNLNVVIPLESDYILIKGEFENYDMVWTKNRFLLDLSSTILNINYDFR